MTTEQDCKGEAAPFHGILQTLYDLKHDEKPNYDELRVKLALIILNKDQDPNAPIFNNNNT